MTVDFVKAYTTYEKISWKTEKCLTFPQGVSICDVDVTKGENEVKQLNQKFGDKVIFIKTDVSKEDEIQGICTYSKQTYKIAETHKTVN